MKCVEDEKWSGWTVNADEPCNFSTMKIIQKLTPGVSLCCFKSIQYKVSQGISSISRTYAS